MGIREECALNNITDLPFVVFTMNDGFEHPRYKRDVCPEREAKAMTDITYDAEADAVYITVGRGNIDRTEEAGPFIYDVDAEGRIVGIEILSASKVLVPGDWKKARSPGESRVGAAG
jgi:uncharacterized protein YuzE